MGKIRSCTSNVRYNSVRYNSGEGRLENYDSLGKIKSRTSSVRYNIVRYNSEGRLENYDSRTSYRTSEDNKQFAPSKYIENIAPKCNIFKNIVIAPEVLEHQVSVFSAKDRRHNEVTDILKRKGACSKAEDGEDYDSIQDNSIYDPVSHSKFLRPYDVTKKNPERKKIPFIEVIQSAEKFLEKRRKQKKEKKDAILGNFQPMKDALPTLELLMQESKVKDQVNKPRASKSFRIRITEMMEDMETCHAVLNDPEYEERDLDNAFQYVIQKLRTENL